MYFLGSTKAYQAEVENQDTCPLRSGSLSAATNVAFRDSLKTKEDTILGQNICIQHREGVWAIGMAQKASPPSEVAQDKRTTPLTPRSVTPTIPPSVPPRPQDTRQPKLVECAHPNSQHRASSTSRRINPKARTHGQKFSITILGVKFTSQSYGKGCLAAFATTPEANPPCYIARDLP
ncbi:hypothetical protein EGR_10341 [Echinococcus granulosus]|uniref:Uncharacterized protein n=1 Tax=Echinococcus granulosus TaxID=6210 RepID=W6U183_ECHGR|nr:hypothetical protein EGR_10341 [Echinococcus granulosus]EUB54788.1 hypothetical protein EGR_10341 [Echinococcus granulosus]